jgi:hypothetical protein
MGINDYFGDLTTTLNVTGVTFTQTPPGVWTVTATGTTSAATEAQSRSPNVLSHLHPLVNKAHLLEHAHVAGLRQAAIATGNGTSCHSQSVGR